MKTALFVETFLHGLDPAGNFPRIGRIMKWLTYYRRIQQDLGFEAIYISNNGNFPALVGEMLQKDGDVVLISRPWLERGKIGTTPKGGKDVYDCLPCWRSCYDYRIPIMDGFQKITILDDDAFILSEKLINHIRGLKSGWTTYWCPKYGFPEGALSTLCEDTFPTYLEFCKTPYTERNCATNPAELVVPYTVVDKSFNCDRWGEERRTQTPDMDGYFQCPIDITMTPKMART